MKLYTTTDLVDISGLSRMGVLRRVRAVLGTRGRRYAMHKTSKGNIIKEYSFTQAEAEKMGLLEKVATVKTAADSTGSNIEELRKLHPLVTDDRFFKLSYFPETTPEV